MALEISNAQFNQFVPLAQQRVKEVIGGNCMLGCGGGAVKADFVLN